MLVILTGEHERDSVEIYITNTNKQLNIFILDTDGQGHL